MEKDIYILVNENAGQGRGKKVLAQIQAFLSEHRMPYTTWKSEYAGHMSLLCQQLIHRPQVIEDMDLLVIGGDGTLSQVINALSLESVKIPITYFPAGRGNDFNRTWQNDESVKQLLNKFLFYRQDIAIPLFKVQRPDNPEDIFVINSIGFGLDGIVNENIENWPSHSPLKTLFKGKLSYVVSTMMSLFKLPSYNFKLLLDGQEETIDQCQLLTVLNSPFFGGGIRLHSQIRKENRELGIVAFNKVGPVDFIKYFWQIIVLKKDVTSKHFHFYKVKNLQIFADQTLTGQYDGELLYQSHFPVKISVETYPMRLMC